MFWGFFQPKRVSAEGIADVVFTELATISKGEKGQSSYNDASDMRAKIGGVHVKVKQAYDNVYY